MAFPARGRWALQASRCVWLTRPTPQEGSELIRRRSTFAVWPGLLIAFFVWPATYAIAAMDLPWRLLLQMFCQCALVCSLAFVQRRTCAWKAGWWAYVHLGECGLLNTVGLGCARSLLESVEVWLVGIAAGASLQYSAFGRVFGPISVGLHLALPGISHLLWWRLSGSGLRLGRPVTVSFSILETLALLVLAILWMRSRRAAKDSALAPQQVGILAGYQPAADNMFGKLAMSAAAGSHGSCSSHTTIPGRTTAPQSLVEERYMPGTFGTSASPLTPEMDPARRRAKHSVATQTSLPGSASPGWAAPPRGCPCAASCNSSCACACHSGEASGPVARWPAPPAARPQWSFEPRPRDERLPPMARAARAAQRPRSAARPRREPQPSFGAWLLDFTAQCREKVQGLRFACEWLQGDGTSAVRIHVAQHISGLAAVPSEDGSAATLPADEIPEGRVTHARLIEEDSNGDRLSFISFTESTISTPVRTPSNDTVASGPEQVIQVVRWDISRTP